MTQLTGISKPTRKEYAPGDAIAGKYGLLRLLGEGGMGSVWVAENMSLKANIALKLIRADVAEASANERFLSEARLAARLQHAAIVRVFDFGKTEHDEPFIVMELLEGETLGQRLARLGAIDPMELVQTLLPIIDALHSAHGHGVIHRDLKPDNVFVAKTEGGAQPKLLDFGIAKLRGEGAFHSTKLTQAGTLIGSPDYMSPEQARGETDLDPRSDVWALCVLAYECLVGKPPFHGDNYNALLWAIIHDEPVPITVFQAGDLELWRILKKGFAKDRNARWESARRLGEALAGWLESHGVMEDICNRSLQSSWLPAERPTRPELAPFDPLAASPHRGSSHVTSIPSPTLTAIRRPHAMSLWFAGLGLLTLVGALFLSKSGDDIPTVDAAHPGHQEVGTLLPVPGPAAETRDPLVRPAGLTQPVEPSPLLDEARSEQEPIGGAALPRENGSNGSSWKANHQPVAANDHGVRKPDEASESVHSPADDSASTSDGKPGDTRSSSRDAATSNKASARTKSRAVSKGTAKRTVEPRKPAESKRVEPRSPAEAKSPLDNEVDFGI
ncbi:MAG TPA: protein kinase [Polyangiaceae bacterium]|nr:protein kinase [Polyangiaceae bacterium]